MNERIKLDNGWVIHIKAPSIAKGAYTIENIQALFGHGIWFDIDTSKFTQENWDMFHERVVEARKA